MVHNFGALEQHFKNASFNTLHAHDNRLVVTADRDSISRVNDIRPHQRKRLRPIRHTL